MTECERRDRHETHAPIGFGAERCPGLPVDLPEPRRARENLNNDYSKRTADA